MRVTSDARFGIRPRHEHRLHVRAIAVTAGAIHSRARGVREPNVPRVIEPQVCWPRARMAPGHNLHVASVVTLCT